MNIVVGILKIIIASANFLFAIVLLFVIGDFFATESDGIEAYAVLLLLLVSINSGVYIMTSAIKNFKKIDLKGETYNYISIALIYLTAITIIIVQFILKPEDIIIGSILLLISLLFVAIYDSVTIKR